MLETYALSQYMNMSDQITQAKIITVVESGSRQDSASSTTVPYQVLEVEILTGEKKGTRLKLETSQAQNTDLTYQVGNKVQLSTSINPDGTSTTIIADFVRTDALINLSVLFVLLVIVVSRWRGLFSLIAMVLSFVVIFTITLPLIMQGWHPVLVSAMTATLIIPVSFYFSHGINRKTHLAIIGTVVSLIITSFLAWFFIAQAKLTGFASEEAGFLNVEKQGMINIRNLILAGVIVGSLGILDDVTVSQASVVEQLKHSNPKFGFSELFSRAMKVGQDHISSMVNTLVLVYAGASLPLLLLFINNPRPISEIMNYEIVAEEIIKTLVGSIGLTFAAPVTTALAAFVFSVWHTKTSSSQQPANEHTHTH